MGKLIFKSLFVIVAISTSLTLFAHNKVVVIPLGADEPSTPTAPTSKKIFYTDELYNGNLGGLLGAVARCQASAFNAGVQGTFKAWLGVPGVAGPLPARSDFTYHNLPYQSVDGTPVALHFLDFLNIDVSDITFTPEIKSVTGLPPVRI